MSKAIKRSWWLYVLNLEDNKYYVGLTSQTPGKRLWEHQNKIRPAKWTLKYKPLGIYYEENIGEITIEEAEKYENKIVRQYMKRLGYNNVRGGDLTDEDQYIVRFGYFFLKEDWRCITTVVLLLSIIAYLALFN